MLMLMEKITTNANGEFSKQCCVQFELVINL